MGAATEAAFAAALADPDRSVPKGVTTVRGVPDGRRFAVYRNNVHVGLMGVLAARFPVTARLVGDEFFTGMSRVFVGLHKPVSPVMMVYGDRFPEFIDGFPPAKSVPYLGDIARLERTWSESYNAADATPLSVAELSRLPTETLLVARLVPHPALRLVRSRFPIGSIWEAHRGAEPALLRNRGPERVMIVRPAADVDVRVLSPSQFAFAEGAAGRVAVAAAAETALALDAGFDVAETLLGMVRSGAFAGLEEDIR